MEVGELVADRFEVEAEAGAGGLGIVYRCRDRASGKDVALKVLDKSMARYRDRFIREAELLETLQHPSIVRHVAHGVLPSGSPYLVMQWIEGEDLMHRLARAPLTLAESLAVARRLASALSVAHENGIVHRDVKPANILLPQGDPTKAVLIDFGIARAGAAPLKMTLPGGILGTPGYMAPEQARADADVDARADVFSVGSVLFECLAGRAAFEGETTMAILAKVLLDQPPSLRSIRPDVPEALSDLVVRMLAKERGDRPANGAALVRELEQAEAGAAPDAQTAAPKKGLTTREQRILSIIVARLGVAARPGDTIVDGPAGSQIRPLGRDADDTAAHDHTLAVPASVDAVRSAATGLGSRVELLLDGSLIALVEGDRSAADQATRAVRCALAIRGVCDKGTSFVVATGRGELAGQLPVGEVIDRAFGLVKDAEGDGVRLDALTARLIEDRFEVARDGGTAILVGERTGSMPPSALGDRPTPCVGRDREIETLIALFDECRERRSPRIALVTGEPGIGKSRLRAELVRRLRLRSEPFLLLTGSGDAARSGAPFAMLRQALRRELGVDDGAPRSSQHGAIRARTERAVESSEVAPTAALLGELVGAPFTDSDDPRVVAARADRQLMGDAMRSAWQDFLEGEARAMPVVLLLEDLQWGDRPSVDFVLSATRALVDAPLFVLAVGRPEARAAFADLFDLHAYTQVGLGPLSRSACGELGAFILGVQDSAAIDEVSTQSGGNPFFLEELLRAKREGRSGALPETVLAMAQTRIDALGPEARRAARAASVLGDDLCDEGLGTLLGRDEATTSRLIAELMRADLVVRRPGAKGFYEFRQGLFRDAAYASLTNEDRLLAHALAAAWLEKRPESSAFALAQHFEKAGQLEKACEPYATAAELAFEGNDLQGAIARGERALACGASGELRGRITYLLAEAHRWAGAHAQSLVYAEEATRLLPVGREAWIGAQVLVASASIMGGDSAPAESTVRTLAIALEAGDFSPHVVAAAARVWRFLGVRRLEIDALPRLLKSLHKARTKDIGARALGLVLNTLSIEAEARGDVEESLHYTIEATACFERAGDLRTACQSRSGTGYYLMELGQYERAAATLRESIAVASRHGLSIIAALCKHNLGPCLFEAGDVEGALRIEREAVDAYVAEGDKRLEAASRYYLGLMLLRTGRQADAEREMREAIERAVSLPALRVCMESGLAHALLARGAKEEALGVAFAAHAPPEANVRPELPTSVRLALLEALVANAHLDEARTLAAEWSAELRARASSLRAPEFRDSMLTRVRENARLLAIADELGADGAASAAG